MPPQQENNLFLFISPPAQPRKTDVWRSADNSPVCFHCGRPGHIVRYCRERKAVSDSFRTRRQNFNEVNAEEDFRSLNFLRQHTPSPNRGRSLTRSFRSPSPFLSIQSVSEP
ncbi:hypothetical protein AVEN_249436-1 [Araneus ventricosus]|uniref:CCHC-type domain-containing protein n=1 Tax=Araneus ventricosus TaxID=182803 RepID=A0A4Y2REW9_ARAVE|nr:hypothetical protein AVEN_249436-1 [Araneus ventricosus]